MSRRWREVILNALACTMPGYVPPSRAGALSDDELWSAWQDSEAALHRSSCVRHLVVLVDRRQDCLDELLRRDQAGTLARVTGGRATGVEDLLRLL